jgi:Pyruvate/2-oxoacid:ferredoxin oxidoreductase delta subunit
MGINNWIKSKTAVTPATWGLVARFFSIVIKTSRYYNVPLLGALLKKIMFFTPLDEIQTRSLIVNINRNVADDANNVVLSIDFMKQVVRNAKFIMIMNNCLCREGSRCADYPVDHGCIFVGEGCRGMAERGIGRQATVEEALRHIDRGAELGLVGQCLWIEVEQYLWGIRDEDLHRFLEICFCCPCCCNAFKLIKNVDREFKSHIHSIGWLAAIGDGCGNCGACEAACPLEAIRPGADRRIVVDEYCVGCGICAGRCPESAITVGLREPPERGMLDFFAGKGLKLDL